MKLGGVGFGPGTFISFALLSKAGRNAISLWKDFFFKKFPEIGFLGNRSDFGDVFKFFHASWLNSSEEKSRTNIANLWVSK